MEPINAMSYPISTAADAHTRARTFRHLKSVASMFYFLYLPRQLTYKTKEHNIAQPTTLILILEYRNYPLLHCVSSNVEFLASVTE
jgi:hypothetical protein